ncbi:hypothetical protein ONZ45_g6173 [Pleurotus djamor]|nr:hypothetical protein ONZ45_g6173 [Pleurotus djamor]
MSEPLVNKDKWDFLYRRFSGNSNAGNSVSGHGWVFLVGSELRKKTITRDDIEKELSALSAKLSATYVALSTALPMIDASIKDGSIFVEPTSAALYEPAKSAPKKKPAKKTKKPVATATKPSTSSVPCSPAAVSSSVPVATSSSSTLNTYASSQQQGVGGHPLGRGDHDHSANHSNKRKRLEVAELPEPIYVATMAAPFYPPPIIPAPRHAQVAGAPASGQDTLPFTSGEVTNSTTTTAISATPNETGRHDDPKRCERNHEGNPYPVLPSPTIPEPHHASNVSEALDKSFQPKDALEISSSDNATINPSTLFMSQWQTPGKPFDVPSTTPSPADILSNVHRPRQHATRIPFHRAYPEDWPPIYHGQTPSISTNHSLYPSQHLAAGTPPLYNRHGPQGAASNFQLGQSRTQGNPFGLIQPPHTFMTFDNGTLAASVPTSYPRAQAQAASSENLFIPPPAPVSSAAATYNALPIAPAVFNGPNHYAHYYYPVADASYTVDDTHDPPNL